MVDATCVLWRSNTDVPRASAACVAAASSGLVHWINGPNVALQRELPWHADQLNCNKFALFRATARLVAVAQLIVISHEAIVCPRTRVRARMNLLACPVQFARGLSLFTVEASGEGSRGRIRRNAAGLRNEQQSRAIKKTSDFLSECKNPLHELYLYTARCEKWCATTSGYRFRDESLAQCNHRVSDLHDDEKKDNLLMI